MNPCDYPDVDRARTEEVHPETVESLMYRFAAALLVLSLSACDGGEDPVEDQEDPVILPEDTDVAEPPVTTPPEPTCGPIELCTRSTQECGYAVTVEVCASWYDEPANCADMDAYTTCNCECVGEPTCDSYYACGEICFAEHC